MPRFQQILYEQLSDFISGTNIIKGMRLQGEHQVLQLILTCAFMSHFSVLPSLTTL